MSRKRGQPLNLSLSVLGTPASCLQLVAVAIQGNQFLHELILAPNPNHPAAGCADVGDIVLGETFVGGYRMKVAEN